MSSAAAAVLQQSPRGGQQLLWAIAGFFLIAIVWAAWAEVDEFTRGEGKVIPSSYLQVIQNLEGGIVAELYVREGQTVQRDQPLLRIDDTRFASSLREAGVTLDQLRAKVARLRAEAEGDTFTSESLPDISQSVAAQELALFESRRREMRSANQVLVEQVSQRRQELSELRAKQNQLQRSFDLLNSELVMTRPLAKEGAISQVELLRLERQLNDMAGELEGAKLAIPRAESSLQEARQKLSNAESAFRSEAYQELNEATAELSRLSETSGALEDRVDRTLVRSPVAGTVKQLFVKTIGGVIQPGMDIVEIVPSEDSLLIEAKIRPADIAFLHPQQRAMVKFTAYDFSIHGGLEGEVVHISPDTIVDENSESFYLVKVQTERGYLGPASAPLPIIPGMTAGVDILTGKKTVLDYLLKPVLKTKQLALRER
ncbi:HlyD family type I secretion periplasmic adaptor subunit [Exilibacterium tricleocarpae]|uniref:Membrane fusion protein (MFP) family protein n=2 Tax=Exilibacterium tricleocarpae TaxID=2591008 RepID=A0A545U732_9GAMM|nr:HlyD family type I secretion periplasmic adaptor subunit [Exilibacterium tricleocarpae]